MQKKLMFRSRVLLGLAGAVAVGLAGCNDDNDDNGGPSVPSATPTAGATAVGTGTPGGTPSATPSGTPRGTPSATATPIVNAFSADYTGVYRATSPATGEVGTFVFTVEEDGEVSGVFSSPFAPSLIELTGRATNAGALQASGTANFGSGSTSRISVTANLRRVSTERAVANGTFTSSFAGSSVTGTILARSANEDDLDLFDGSYSGSFVNEANTAQNGTFTATIEDAIVTARIAVPGIGTINGSGIVDLFTGQITLTAPFQLQNTGQFLGLSGRLVRSGASGVVGSGAFRSSAGGRGTFRVTKDSN